MCARNGHTLSVAKPGELTDFHGVEFSPVRFRVMSFCCSGFYLYLLSEVPDDPSELVMGLYAEARFRLCPRCSKSLKFAAKHAPTPALTGSNWMTLFLKKELLGSRREARAL